ncbi:SagB/ThcOx family dehydrogenase [Lactobacillus taiwanensis]|uniref:Nitroreductase domain-containing protein n=1 Tax=Lactobacillus taiwanensis TaxID=508451 RepID=A0A256L9G5_9LACO|nr:SagB/ThcOx family dehydrogenase [Lactobacillus taiwanensis]OYR86753.1 hypothetical protein CBF53_11050 [Lactobacillus taiwanensis]OYR89773.1 hypothetical protein CBF70_11545 [Lactobacillus taiwanensis]OYR90552.1 hypothetical protein CBF59_08485 [Lactobacillus taiwanensis]OYR95918.1 hypothetical protein CBF58_04900 [Lactobacillus taiwanensis]OYR97898.1 hypothetical protein CBF51_01540 [Lactobacillus taiwanensis]
MDYNAINDYGNRLKKINFGRTISLDSGTKEQYYDRFIKKADFWNLEVDNDFNTGKYAKSFEMYSDQIGRKFSTSFELNETLKKAIFLPPAEKNNKRELEELFKNRISRRKFDNTTWSLQNLSNLFSGIKALTDNHRGYASGGGLYPVNLYFFTQNIIGLENFSVYRYQPCSDSVIKISKMRYMDFTSYIHIENLINSKNIKLALYLVANRTKNEFKYGERATFFSLLESGEMIQNIALCASQYDYKMCQLGGYDIEKSNETLNIDGITSFITACAVLGG